MTIPRNAYYRNVLRRRKVTVECGFVDAFSPKFDGSLSDVQRWKRNTALAPGHFRRNRVLKPQFFLEPNAVFCVIRHEGKGGAPLRCSAKKNHRTTRAP